MQALENIAISASAGSGKTYRLTNRFIQLLHLTEQPERIIALTFTRSAAGEFFHKIIEKLCDAANCDRTASKLSEELNIEADAHRYMQLLKRLIQSMHRLNLQTLDSFFYRIVAAFSLELGLSGSLKLLDESTEPRVRREVQDSIIHQSGELATELNEFWHAFKQATFGQEQRSVQRTIGQFIDDLHGLFLEEPDANVWGATKTIWPNGCPWLVKGQLDWDALADALGQALPDDLSKAQQNDFTSAQIKIRQYPVNEELNALLKNAFAAAPEIFAGNASLKVRKEIHLSPALCQALASILQAVVWHHLHRSIQNTQGVYRILRSYDANYDRIVRRTGRLAFSDLTHLLQVAGANSPLNSVESETRLLMDYRLDGQFDHWLFDEFQDTSRSQWQVVSNLVDEIVQDSSGERSLFYVGDTKQCLYLWRNGDDRLFHQILDQYSGLIAEENLATSWRSSPAILNAVNEVFDSHSTIEECFNSDVAQRWKRAWRIHKPSEATIHLSGYACWLEASEAEGPTRNERILQILQEIDPIQRGLSVGILVRKNDDANEIADFIRSHSQLPVHTGSAVRPGTDNAAGIALLQLLRLAAHPGDQLARGYLCLIDQSTKGTPLLDAVASIRHTVLLEGAEAGVRKASKLIIEHLNENDQRHVQQLENLIEAARQFEYEENRDLGGLYQFLYDKRSGECDPGGAVIIETIHKSKGLEYDLVLLVQEEKTSSMTIDRRISPKRDFEGKAEWIIEPLKKDIMQADPALKSLLHQGESQGGFEALCRLYVGMTRAKQGLYMISDTTRASRGSLVKFLQERLGSEAKSGGIFWETGQADWYRTADLEEELPTTETELPRETIDPFKPAHPRLILARPSTKKAIMIPASKLFDPEESSARFGTEVHDAFEQIEWLAPEGNLNLNTFPEPIKNVLHRCFADPQIQSLFNRPKATTQLWREKAFSHIDGDQFFNGVFDRVHLFPDHTGKILRAQIIDFKTDRIHSLNTIEESVERHRPQLEAYREALSAITEIDKEQIELILIFTDLPKLVQL